VDAEAGGRLACGQHRLRRLMVGAVDTVCYLLAHRAKRIIRIMPIRCEL
jgi:hypothetical protein